MSPATKMSTLELIQELARIEDRMYVLRAAAAGADPDPSVDREIARLAGREEQVLSALRRQRTSR